jgi:NSS family neurotransmitter:Na+ symporter
VPSNQPRITFSSSLGTVLATAGVAIGLGNIWRFPYMMGEYGGSAFLLIYVAIIVAFGIPVLMAEWALGRHTRQGPIGAFQAAGVPGGRWVAAVLIFALFMAASYYGVVLAWVLGESRVFVGAALGADDPTGLRAVGGGVLAQYVYIFLTMGLACAVILLGVRGGIERASKLLMPLFFVLFVVLIVRTLTLDGAGAALASFLTVRFADLRPDTPLAALGQAFFSIGLGGTFMVAYGSYLRDEQAIPGAAIGTVLADLSAALMAGLIIVPAVIVLGHEMSGGPRLLFQVMPDVFGTMPAGNAYGTIFFFAVFVVGLLSLIAAYEVIIDALTSTLGWRRGTATAVLLVLQLGVAFPAIWFEDYIRWSDLVWGTTMQPLGSAVAIVVATWCIGRASLLEQIRRESNLPVPVFLFYWLKYVVPVGVTVVLVYGWVSELRD